MNLITSQEVFAERETIQPSYRFHSILHETPADSAITTWPRSLLACFPLLWTRVLFPGKAEVPGPWQWRPFIILILLTGVLLYPCLSFYLFEPDEGRYAQIPREMLLRGEWITPLLQGQPYLDKPPLFYWLIMLSYQLFGVSAAAARLVPALAVQVSVLLVYLIGRTNRAAAALTPNN